MRARIRTLALQAAATASSSACMSGPACVSTMATAHRIGQQQDSATWWHAWLAAPLAVAAWTCTQQSIANADSPAVSNSEPAAAAPASSSGLESWTSHLGKLLPLNTKQRVFFSYEKRIRDMSSLDKVFEYFSSQERGSSRYMLPKDLLHALVPTYPASRSTEERSGSLAGERRQQQSELKEHQNKFFQQFDLDGDGVLDFHEFQLVVTLLSIPQGDVEVMFDAVDLDGNGVVDVSEFQAILRMLQGQAGISSYGIKRQAALQATLHGAPCGLLVSFFGPDQSGKLGLKEFKAFLSALNEELLKLEFQHYMPDERNLIPGIDFARSLVVAAELSQAEVHLNQVDSQAAQLSKMRISWEEFVSIDHLQEHLHELKVALECMDKVGRPVGKQELGRLVAKFCGVKLSEQVLDVVMLVFGKAAAGGQTTLNAQKFLEAMRRKGNFWARRVNSWSNR